jgi:tetratricopeptide (TPR) repeat protein
MKFPDRYTQGDLKAALAPKAAKVKAAEEINKSAAEDTPASSCYVKDKEGRKNESTAHAEPQPANPAGGATEQAQSTSGTSDMQHLFTCMHLCGFTAAYDEVATHETTCSWRQGMPAAAATVDASALAVKGTQDGMPSKAGTEARASMGMDEATTEAQRTAEEAKERGNERFRQQRWEAAAREYTSAVNLSKLPRFQRPDLAAVYLHNRAACYIRLQRLEEAVEDCEAALALSTDFWKAGARAGKALLMMGDFERALAHLEHAETAANTKFDETTTARRMVDEVKKVRQLIEAGDSEQALSCIKSIINETPNAFPLEMLHLQTLLACGRFGEALPVCEHLRCSKSPRLTANVACDLEHMHAMTLVGLAKLLEASTIGQHAVAGMLSVGGNPVTEAGPDVSLKKAAAWKRKKRQKAKKQTLKLEEKLKLAMQVRQQQEAVEKLEEAQQVAKQKLEVQVKRKRSKEQKRKQDQKQRKRRKRQEAETMPASEVEVQPPTEQVQAHQDAGTWTRDMDSHLSNFVRKYGFDFAKSSNALRAYVQHILVDMDDMEIDSQTITEESCRTRWSLLDRTAPERGQNIARELVTARGAREELICGPSATLGGLETPSVATGADGTREGPVRRQITSTKDSVAATEAGSEGRGKQTASGVHRPKSVATTGRDSKQRQRMKARQEASKKRKHRKSSKLKLQGMAHVNPADKRGKGTARATRKQKRVANDTRRAHAIALDRATETGVTGGQRLCKFFLNEGDAKRLRALSLSVPTGKHILTSCSKKNNCKVCTLREAHMQVQTQRLTGERGGPAKSTRTLRTKGEIDAF